jgi:hypothetical protein
MKSLARGVLPCLTMILLLLAGCATSPGTSPSPAASMSAGTVSCSGALSCAMVTGSAVPQKCSRDAASNTCKWQQNVGAWCVAGDNLVMAGGDCR